MRAFSGSIVSGQAARHLRVAAWVAFAVTALPYAVVGQCTPLTCDTAVTASIDTDSEVDCFTFTAGDSSVAYTGTAQVRSTIPVTRGLHGGTVIDAAWQLIDGAGFPVEGPCGEFGQNGCG
jgi:hypothetical protein